MHDKKEEDSKSAFPNIGPLSIRNEEKALKHILRITSESLGRYPTSLAQDLSLLEKDRKAGSLSFNEKNCILMRSGEKRILHYFQTLATYSLELLKIEDTKVNINRH